VGFRWFHFYFIFAKFLLDGRIVVIGLLGVYRICIENSYSVATLWYGTDVSQSKIHVAMSDDFINVV
jgi:hypothetical protein